MWQNVHYNKFRGLGLDDWPRSEDIRPMTYSRINNSSHASGANGTTGFSGGFSGMLQSMGRLSLLVFSAFIGIGFLIFTASAAFVLLLTILFLGVAAFGFFWVRAKVFGKPFGGAQFSAYRQAAQNPFRDGFADKGGADYNNDQNEDVIDAVQTPNGWTVEK